jgi:hypothetical protein
MKLGNSKSGQIKAKQGREKKVDDLNQKLQSQFPPMS